MPKTKISYICQQCGTQHPKWSGQCDGCGEWNTLEETEVTKGKSKKSRSKRNVDISKSMVKLSDVGKSKTSQHRLSTGMEEFDRVLGSSTVQGKKQHGIVQGSVILIGGEPGIGKSTLLTQLCSNMLINQSKKSRSGESPEKEGSKQQQDGIVYVAGEESPYQITQRIERLVSSVQSKKSISANWREHFVFITSSDVDEVCTIISKQHPKLIIIDSIQSLTTQESESGWGSMVQLREVVQRLTTTAKSANIPMFLVGHVTKGGEIAGPKVVEHLVDAVLELSGERSGEHRILRSVKNRFGPTDEVGIFAMEEGGLKEVTNPSELFLEHSQGETSGSATVCIMEGTRPLLLEVEALVVRSNLAIPRRVTQGIRLSRLQVICAVLTKHLSLRLNEMDVFVSVVGGMSIKEPSVDLGVAMAIVSSAYNKPLPKKSVFVGEVGLLGEVRRVTFLPKRIKEAKRLGFSQVISREKYENVKQVVKSLKLRSKK